jgi:hypothetical protein
VINAIFFQKKKKKARAKKEKCRRQERQNGGFETGPVSMRVFCFSLRSAKLSR